MSKSGLESKNHSCFLTLIFQYPAGFGVRRDDYLTTRVLLQESTMALSDRLVPFFRYFFDENPGGSNPAMDSLGGEPDFAEDRGFRRSEYPVP